MLQFLLRYSSTIQYTFNNFQWQKKCPNLPFVFRWGKNLFKNPVYSVSHAPWCPVCSFGTSSDITFSSFHGWKSVLCMHVCPGEFQEIYVGSKPKGICSDGQDIPRLLEVLFCKLNCLSPFTLVFFCLESFTISLCMSNIGNL